MAWLTETSRLNKETAKKDTYYGIAWREVGRVRTKGLGFIPAAEAKAMLKVFEGKLALGGAVEPPTTGSGSAPAVAEPAIVATVTSYLDAKFLPVVARDKAPKTASSARGAAKNLQRLMGDTPIERVDFATVDAYISTRRREGRKSRTIAIELWLLRGCLAHAADCKVIPEVPRLPTVKLRDRKPHRFLSPDESVRLLAELRPLDVQPHVVTRGAPPICRDRLTYLAVLMALNLGMRKGEILSRGWEDVRWLQGQHGTLFVGAKPSIGFLVKTRRERAVPLTPELRAELVALHLELGKPAAGWVFPAPGQSGKPRQDFGIALRRACRRAGLPVVHPHALRHTWASRLAMAGVDRRTLMELGGWVSGVMLDEIYAHATDSHKEAVMARMGVGSG